MMGECPGPDGVALFVDAALAVTAPASEPAIIPAVATPKMNFRMKSLPIRVALNWTVSRYVSNYANRGNFDGSVNRCLCPS